MITLLPIPPCSSSTVAKNNGHKTGCISHPCDLLCISISIEYPAYFTNKLVIVTDLLPTYTTAAAHRIVPSK
jgi:hypothetical protein